MSNIHPQAIVEPGAKIGKNVTIEPFAVVKKTVTLGDNVTIKSHAYIDGNTQIGEGTTIWPGASIGTKTQDLKFQGETTYVVIGKRCEIREFVTINSSCQENSTVRIGDDCLIMAYCHVAHNCEIGNRVVMSNSAMLAGHVIVGDCAIIGGMTPVHQFSRIGSYAMVGGFSRVPRDIPPYTVGGGFPYKFGGVNIIGLKRHKFPLEVRIALSKAFKITYRSGLHLEDAIRQIEREVGSHKEVQHWIDFCKTSKRGLIGLEGVTRNGAAANEDEGQYFEE
ncbi:MAG: acyl-[acyl-carrier-protein]--UDP-N-acetylglucosamine O-acyltransferase [Chlamydiae bacterium RIFCSPHIGHO2_12_FULL_49_9]|nr:MAG: acyl-[acyl-carrier-protein]--UDP-N-acetylglucosamine O-acyltransferase [Chlamydiae bacterium RIFCSPHIGHO2_12_FULL_49_9]